MHSALGLSPVPDEDLEDLVRLIYKGHIPFPLERRRLLELGMNRLADHGDVLIGLDERGTRAVLSAVLAERRARRAGAAGAT